MKILITGATGLVGTELSKSLINKGHTIHYLTTSPEKIDSKTKFKGFYWNPKKNDIDINCLESVEAIIHLAGANIAQRWTNSYKKEILDSRILSTNLLFQSLKNNKNQVNKFICASGTAIYPDSETNIYTEDSTIIADGFLSNVVQEWEANADKISELNITVCKLRTGIVYAKNGGALQEIVKPIKLGIGSNYGTGNQMQSWIHIADLVAMYEFILNNSISGVVNAVSPTSVSDKMLTKTIASILKRALFMPNIPRFVMKTILGDMHELLFTDKNISTQKIINEGFEFQYTNIEVALRDILS